MTGSPDVGAADAAAYRTLTGLDVAHTSRCAGRHWERVWTSASSVRC